MRIRFAPFIIGLVIAATGLLTAAPKAHALYSPRLTQGVQAIRQHIESSESQHGSRSVLEEVENFKAYDKAKREMNEETGIPGNVKVAQEMILNSINLFKPYDTLGMIFNFNYVNEEVISNCLRNDIWQLETLRDKVGSEMLKAYMLRDTYHGNLLASDYAYLTTNIRLLRKNGSNPQAPIFVTNDNFTFTVTSHEYFFKAKDTADDQLNYYSNVDQTLGYGQTTCPEGAFEKAVIEVVNAWKTLNNTVGGHSMFSAEKWGDIYGMAQANARARARQWIRANQLSLTVGGEQGGKVESLIQRDGLNRFKGSVKTQLKILENLVGPVTPFFDSSIYEAPAEKVGANTRIGEDCVYYYHEDNIFRDCLESQLDEYERCQDDAKETEARFGIDCSRYQNRNEIISISNKLARKQAEIEENRETKEEAKTAFVYNLTFDSVAENNIYLMDEALWDINMHIQRGYEDAGSSDDKGIPSITRYIESLSNKQCANKGG